MEKKNENESYQKLVVKENRKKEVEEPTKELVAFILVIFILILTSEQPFQTEISPFRLSRVSPFLGRYERIPTFRISVVLLCCS
jgi:hypothetical protein